LTSVRKFKLKSNVHFYIFDNILLMKKRRKSQGGRPLVESRAEATVEEIHPVAVIPSVPPTTVEFLQVMHLYGRRVCYLP